MIARDDAGRDIGPAQHRARERLLTQPDPAKIRKSSDAVVLKGDSLFLLSAESGDVPFALPHAHGLFFHDCRFLDGYTLTLNGAPLTVLSAEAVRSVETHHHLANREQRDAEGRVTLAKNTIEVRRARLIRGAVVHELLSLHNYGAAAAALRLELRFRARFEDIFVVKRFVSGPRGSVRPPRVEDGRRVVLSYDGRDGVRRSTTLTFEPPPKELAAERALHELRLGPGERADLSIAIQPAENRAGAAGAGTRAGAG
ncbi:MAG TPA: glycogen debranching N-terminal domain-containing protein, partial [Candidatus Tectomicrobia bacterium]|nr:glycogen debranching N-terminal domain-containing protein [Candidatus Tectomicrobia bacterium]